MAGEKLVITWMDGVVATYDDVTHSTQDGWLYIYRDSRVLWRHPRSNIRAVGGTVWRPDENVNSEREGRYET